MSKSQQILLRDVLAINRILDECRDLGADSTTWMAHLVEQTAKLLNVPFCQISEDVYDPQFNGINLGIALWGWHNGFNEAYWPKLFEKFITRGPTFSPLHLPYHQRRVNDAGVALSQVDLITEREWEGSEYYEGYHRVLGAGGMLSSFAQSTKGLPSGLLFIMCNHRGERDFSQRTKNVMQLMSISVANLLGRSLASYADPKPSELTPRCQDVLACMLQGDGDKHIAKRLLISPYTVNQHVKTIYRHFGVHSRPELLAFWLQRRWPVLPLRDE
jgi:DNA-binding CsgD family transcriptional regulator